MKRLIAALALVLPLAVHAGLDEGVAAYSSGDYETALAEFRALADQGNPDGEYFLGLFYHNGFGVKRDQTESIKWFLRAAGRGDPRSQYYVGIMSEKGQGVPKDLVAAHMWLSLSAKNPKTPHRDSLYTQKAIGELEKKMSEEQVAKSREMARTWKPAS